jgi:hypothetical protein
VRAALSGGCTLRTASVDFAVLRQPDRLKRYRDRDRSITRGRERSWPFFGRPCFVLAGRGSTLRRRRSTRHVIRPSGAEWRGAFAGRVGSCLEGKPSFAGEPALLRAFNFSTGFAFL